MQTLSLLPVSVTLQFARGYAATLSLAFADVDGVAVSLSGDTITMSVEDETGTTKATATGTITDAAGGLATVTLSAADLTDTATGISRYAYVITRTHVAVVIPWWGGTLELHEVVR